MPPSNPEPWSHDGLPTKPKRMGLRFVVWFALLFALVGGVWTLADLFPGRAESDWSKAGIIQGVALVWLFSAGAVFASRERLRVVVRNVGIWAGIVLVLLLGYAYQDELS